MAQAQWLSRPTSDIAIFRGHPLPLGATVQPAGINFAIASRYATAVTLLIFLPGTREPLLEAPLRRPLPSDGRGLARLPKRARTRYPVCLPHGLGGTYF